MEMILVNNPVALLGEVLVPTLSEHECIIGLTFLIKLSSSLHHCNNFFSRGQDGGTQPLIQLVVLLLLTARQKGWRGGSRKVGVVQTHGRCVRFAPLVHLLHTDRATTLLFTCYCPVNSSDMTDQRSGEQCHPTTLSITECFVTL